jgi:hypothetical protein
VLVLLFTGFNIAAWNWVKSAQENEVGWVLFQSEEYTGYGYFRSRETIYSGLNPGIVIHSVTTSYVISALVGGLLPLLAARALFRKRTPVEAISVAVAGAPR